MYSVNDLPAVSRKDCVGCSVEGGGVGGGGGGGGRHHVDPGSVTYVVRALP